MQKLLSRSKKRRKEVVNAINVTPFVDVMLVLLIIFMITSPMLVAGINVDLPESTASKMMSESDEPISVNIDRVGNVYINDMRVLTKSLASKLKAITKANREIRIFVRSDKAVEYGRVVKVIGLINDAGFAKVALVTNVSDQE